MRLKSSVLFWKNGCERAGFLKYLYWFSGVFCLAVMGCHSGSSGGEAARESGLSVHSLRCEYLDNPLGLDTQVPRLSWVIHSGKNGIRQSAYQILAASCQEKLDRGIGDLWDSGKVLSEQSVHVNYSGNPLRSGQECFWKVRIWDQNGRRSDWSESAYWMTGLLEPDGWKARWIQIPSPAETAGSRQQIQALYPLPIFRKTFSVKSDIQKAFVFVCGLGHYELYLNGGKVGDHFLDPPWTVYEKTVYYNTFDITDSLRQGTNALGMMLGKGFYNTHGDRRVHGVKVYRPLKLILQAHILYKDGSEQIVVSDASWKWTRGPITHCAILGGSSYDARLLPSGWAEPAFDDTQWLPVEETVGPGGLLKGMPAPPMKTFLVFKPRRIDEPEPGYFVYDFGQNASFIPKIVLAGPAGCSVRLTPAEQRRGQTDNANNGKGRVNQAGIGAGNYWEYTLRGEGLETWSPAFTYTGFQYLEVSGAVPEDRPNPQHLPVIKELLAVQVRNAPSAAGTFACSNPLFNEINQLIDWSVQSNMAHVLTDCPHREKLGWLEQSYLMGPSILWNYDAAAFFTKIICDIRDSQDPSGQIFTVAPNYPSFEGGFRYSPEWGAAGVFLPWLVYQWYGDIRVLEENYDMMKRYVDWMHSTSDDLIAVAGLGDWYDYGHGQSLGPSRFTPKALTAAATFFGCTQVLARTAAHLGKMDEARTYGALCAKIQERFNQEFFDGSAVYQNFGSPQTANAMALVFSLPPPQTRRAVLQAILDDLEKRNWQQTAGDIGFPYLVKALSDFGCSDVLWRITNRTEVGSYGGILKQGWTCLPEAWDATVTSSMNHLMLGHIQQWFQQDLVGIRPHPQAAGFKKILVRPEPAGDLTWCSGSHRSCYGLMEVSWSRKAETFHLEISIPCNTTAEVYLPADSLESVYLNGRKFSNSQYAVFRELKDGRAVFTLLSGHYTFGSRLP